MARRTGDIWAVVVPAGVVGFLGYALVRMMATPASTHAVKSGIPNWRPGDSALSGTHYTPAQVARIAYDAGWRGDALVTAVSIALAESGGWSGATLKNRNAQGEVSSIDRGLFQINGRYWPGLSDADAMDAQRNARYAHDAIWAHFGFSPWATYHSDAHEKQRPIAMKAIQEAGVA